MVKVAIHHRAGSFSDRWIKYCQLNSIDYKIVNAFDTDIVQQVAGCDCFLWHYHQSHYKDVKAAKNILFALEHSGIRTFPNSRTAWHFDDKVAQKYLLEAIRAPIVPSYIFYDREEALSWINKTSFPKVFKLKGGAGSQNVKLVKTRHEAIRLTKQAFSRGFPQFNKLGNLTDRISRYKEGDENLIGVGKGIARLVITPEFSRKHPNESGYIYFQDFIPNNQTDFRIKVVGNKAWGFQRCVRNNDFRASGSGKFIFDNSQIPDEMITNAFNVANSLKLQSVAFDFVVDKDSQSKIIEMSYGFGIDKSEFDYGYWDDNLKLYHSSFDPQDWMIENLINECQS